MVKFEAKDKVKDSKNNPETNAKTKDRLFEYRSFGGQGEIEVKAKNRGHNFSKLWSANFL